MSINDWELYRALYMQLILTVLLLVAFLVTIGLALFFARRNQKKLQEDALRRKQQRDSRRLRESRRITKRYRNRILAFMVVVMLFSLYTIVSATYNWVTAQMRSEADKYEYKLAKWIDAQKSVLDMFVSTISTNPEMLKDYEGTITYLDEVTKQYPEISASYMASPDLNPTVYMNTGWKPEPGWELEERPWYKSTLESQNGWSVSTPYYDSQTGGYCVTISEQVHDARTGEFLGIFGIDFYMDKLIEIMGGGYSDREYAFLVDAEGHIVNHPYGIYQMSKDSQTSVLELPYGSVRTDGNDTRVIRDYDGSLKILLATVNETSRFTVYVVSDALAIYGRVILYGLNGNADIAGGEAWVGRVCSADKSGRQEATTDGLSKLQMIFGERNVKETALIADRELFQAVYRSMVRLSSSNGWELHLVEFTLQGDGEQELSTHANHFVELSSHLLRSCDVILKYSDRQVIFLLMQSESGDSGVPIERVLSAWEQQGDAEVTIDYQHEQVV